jgi:hypothetical protein
VSLIPCPECAYELSERAPSSPGCGVPIFRESKVVVHGYTQQFLINPKIKVSWNGAELGSVKKGAVLTHEVAIDGEISFPCKRPYGIGSSDSRPSDEHQAFLGSHHRQDVRCF